MFQESLAMPPHIVEAEMDNTYLAICNTFALGNHKPVLPNQTSKLVVCMPTAIFAFQVKIISQKSEILLFRGIWHGKGSAFFCYVCDGQSRPLSFNW